MRSSRRTNQDGYMDSAEPRAQERGHSEELSKTPSIQSSCEAIWGCQHAAQAVPILQSIHQSLIHPNHSALDYDPSEAFLAIQGAALRFHPSKTMMERPEQDHHREAQKLNEDNQPEKPERNSPPVDDSPDVLPLTTEEKQLYWDVAEESLWAAAALACVSVGPAWRSQSHRRKTWLAQRSKNGSSRFASPVAASRDQEETQSAISDTEDGSFFGASATTPKDIAVLGSERSFSPVTTSIQSINLYDSLRLRYPTVPEVLPAAMLRFAASFLSLIPAIEKDFDMMRKIVVAQRNLVLAICCESPSMSSKNTNSETPGQLLAPSKLLSAPKSTEWLIPGAHALVGDMMVFWLRVATQQYGSEHENPDDTDVGIHAKNRNIDWWLTLGVTRAATDLVGTGWRPLPNTDKGTQVVANLLTIAEKGIELLDRLTGSRMNREHRLAASSSAAEAIGGLASLGSRGLIPSDSQLETAKIACRLHVTSGRIKARASIEEYSRPSGSVSENSKFQQERDIFITQIESCFADTADFLWVLFATVSSSKRAITALLTMVDCVRWGSDACILEGDWDSSKKLACMEAGTGIRMVSAALWGRPPDVVEIPHLRSCWPSMLKLIREVARSTHEKVRDEIGEVKRELVPLTRDLLSLALDLLVALGNFVDRELVGGSGLVLDLEWEYFLSAFQEAFLPWLSYPNFEGGIDEEMAQTMPIIERAQLEIESLLLRIGALLDKCVRMEGSILHSVVTYEIQRDLYLIVMQKSIPHMDPTDAELLGMSTVRAWSKFGFFPFRYENWADTASEIISEAFCVYADGAYVHSTKVRLEALRVLTFRDDAVDDRLEGVNVSELSLLDMTQDMREIHYPLVDRTIIPVLKLILRQQDRGGLYPILPRGTKLCSIDDLSSSSSDDNYELEKYAVRLVGRLARSRSGDRQHRLLLIEILRSTALDERWEDQRDEDHVRSFADKSGKLHERIVDLDGSVRLEAIRELEDCLAVPFTKAVTIHEIVPPIIKALQEILSTYTGPPGGSEEDITLSSLQERAVLALASMIPLARLRTSETAKLSLLSRRDVIRHLPDSIIPFVTQTFHENQPDASHPPTIAPFIEIEGSPRFEIPGRKSIEKSWVALSAVFTSVTAALGSSRAARMHVDAEVASIFDGLNILCYRSVSSLLLSGFRMLSSDLVERFLYSCTIGSDETPAFSETLISVFQVSLAERVKLGVLKDEADPWRAMRSIFKLMLPSLQSHEAEECVAVGRALPTIARTLHRVNVQTKAQEGDPCDILSIFELILKRLQLGQDSSSPSTEKERSEMKMPTYTVFASLLAAIEDILQLRNHPFPLQSKQDLILACVKIISLSEAQGYSHCSYTALRCLVTAVDRFSKSEAESVDYINSVLSKVHLIIPPHLSESNPFSLDRLFLELMISELFDERRSHEDNEFSDDPFKASHFYHHESMAIELDKMERFLIDKSHDDESELKSSWLCGDAILLTFRVGASDSRYRGWVELVIRSPVSRKRLMVRTFSRLTLGNPDFYAYRWQPELEDEMKGMSEPETPREDYNSDAIMERYHSLVARFDEIITSTPQESHESDLSQDPRRQATSEVQHKRGGAFHAPGMQPINATASSLQAATCIHDWLVAALKDEDDVEEVELALVKEGFPKLILNHERPPSIEERARHPMKQRYPISRLEDGPNLARAISLVDRTSPSTTHKFALLYAGPRRIGAPRDPESILLEGQSCSPTFYRFADKLGPMVQTKHLKYFSAGLDTSTYQSDGEFTRVWVGDTFAHLSAARSIVVYHSVNIMPDVVNNRKRHVGNDCVHIVFVDKDSPVGEDFDLKEAETDPLVSGHFGFVTIFVSQLPGSDAVRVCTRIRSGLALELRRDLLPMIGNDIIAFDDSASFVRGAAIRADIACRSVLDNLAPASNCHERYRLLRDMKRHEFKG